jgi:hypothetical protein
MVEYRYIIMAVTHFGCGDNITEKTEVWAYTPSLSGIARYMEDAFYRADDYYYVVDSHTGEIVG